MAIREASQYESATAQRVTLCVFPARLAYALSGIAQQLDVYGELMDAIVRALAADFSRYSGRRSHSISIRSLVDRWRTRRGEARFRIAR